MSFLGLLVNMHEAKMTVYMFKPGNHGVKKATLFFSASREQVYRWRVWHQPDSFWFLPVRLYLRRPGQLQ